jgi:putative colanic acid biosynthesis glycosyltransferase
LKRDNPLFSVVTVCYNDRSNLEKTASSVLGQSFDGFEWIVVDGNSSDGSQDVLERIADDRLSWSSEDDRGLFDAMNKGMNRAKGRYFIFMNSGDTFFDSCTLNTVARAIADSPVEPAFIYGDSIDCSDNGNAYYRRAKSHLLHWRGQFAQHQAMFFRNTSLRYDLAYRVTADYAFIGEFLKSVKTPAEAIRLNAPVCRFLLGGINEKKRFKALSEDFVIRRRVFGMSLWSSGLLYGLHFSHTLVKRLFPSAVYAARRLSRPSSSSLLG